MSLKAKQKLLQENAAVYDEHEIWKLVRHVSHLMARARQKELDGYDVTPIQAGVLICIKSFDEPVSLSMISRWILREQNSVSQLLDRMEKQGLIAKAEDQQRRNVVRVTITAKGEAVYRQSKDVKFLSKILLKFSPEELENFWKCLEKMRVLLLEELVRTKYPFS